MIILYQVHWILAKFIYLSLRHFAYSDLAFFSALLKIQKKLISPKDLIIGFEVTKLTLFFF